MTDFEAEYARQRDMVIRLAEVIGENCPRRDGDAPDETEARAIIAFAAEPENGGVIVTSAEERRKASAFAEAMRALARDLDKLPHAMRPHGWKDLLSRLVGAQLEIEWKIRGTPRRGRTKWPGVGVYRECRAIWLRRGRAERLPRHLNDKTHSDLLLFVERVFEVLELPSKKKSRDPRSCDQKGPDPMSVARAFAERADVVDVGDFEAYAVGARSSPPGSSVES